MRWWTAIAAGLSTFAVALAAFLFLEAGAQAGSIRVLVAARALPAGTVLSATTLDLSRDGELVRLGNAASASDVIPQRDYPEVAGATTLVSLQRGQLLLWHDLALPRAALTRLVSLRLASLPAGVVAGDRVDVFAVSGTETGEVVPGANLCAAPVAAGCVVPLAASVLVAGVDPAAQTMQIAVTPNLVGPWLFMDATQLLWVVPAGTRVCPGSEVPIAEAGVALAAIHRHAPAPPVGACPGSHAAGARLTARARRSATAPP